MRIPEVHAVRTMCEACDQDIVTKIVIGMKADANAYSPVYLCKKCGPINIDLMQFCRELTIGCNEN